MPGSWRLFEDLDLSRRSFERIRSRCTWLGHTLEPIPYEDHSIRWQNSLADRRIAYSYDMDVSLTADVALLAELSRDVGCQSLYRWLESLVIS